MSPALRRLGVGVAVAAAALLVVLGLAPALGFRWDPFDRASRRIAALEVRLAQAEAAAAASSRLARAEAEQSVRLEHHHRRTAAATTIVADLTAAVRESPDAHLPLPPDRAARLRDADRRLCGLAPDLCDAPEDQSAGGRDDAVPTARAAGSGDSRGP
ncbi:MAG: hypothetical protein KJ676_02480 [Alphaproteobacteria bacterium]|nr:hypothetical protein [Alphaproteobacteria bacterium]MBU1524833.1 hypothetical protein [Alphaproteobacteria bacterium]MBU2116286.1 hypothetical protein [Alphaproteobacteria bacterium]MBU2350776.1 hypothetical protein [Alphaproteobacteria bacterium]MBU2381985.1 hypothetical protein [Alphaproteobacteria bacterium]